MLRFFRFKKLTVFFYLAIAWVVLFAIEQKESDLVVAVLMFIMHFLKVLYNEKAESM